ARHQTSEEPILPDGLFAFLSSGQRAGMPPRWRCAYRGYVPVAGQGAQHRLRENPSYITVDK
ncbi:hypothetical protein NL359_23040, partial [Klebsiella pneumoniae]|nr:hypothetical protein [Klebsiella pneumoniae]MCJ4558059.1 hypothetical protein [Klebsiella pneumoniae]MCP5628412.1 hypothetical protein [Klebsiella pneumoniae]MCP5748033.1 hypothetical protein [Klebsiella pneumoniae]MCP5882156.1 hypothetical protein [Klebsiella pneumoniae]